MDTFNTFFEFHWQGNALSIAIDPMFLALGQLVNQ